MYARSTTFLGDPQRIGEAHAYVRDRAMPALMGMAGYVGISMIGDRTSGRCIVTTSWDGVEALVRSASETRGMRARAADILRGLPALQDWQVAVVHRARPAPEGARTRVVWARTDPDRLDATLDAYAEKTVPRLAGLPGFCSVSVLAELSEGRSATAVTFTDGAALVRAEADLTRLVSGFAEPGRTEVTDDATFDLLLAHLRVPETV